MKKRRGYPDRRGMGSHSDSISEQFVPTERYIAQQKVIAETLLGSGFTPEQIAVMFPALTEPSSTEKSKHD